MRRTTWIPVLRLILSMLRLHSGRGASRSTVHGFLVRRTTPARWRVLRPSRLVPPPQGPGRSLCAISDTRNNPRQFIFDDVVSRTGGDGSGSNSNSNTTEPFETSAGEFVEHIVIRSQSPLTAGAVVHTVLERRRAAGATVTDLSAPALLRLGAVWHLPADAPRHPALGGRPERLLAADAPLGAGDYLRIHHHPRRFPVVHGYDWARPHAEEEEEEVEALLPLPTAAGATTKPGVIVAHSDAAGWMVICKPPGAPVHPTVDNRLENVAACLRAARRRGGARAAAGDSAEGVTGDMDDEDADDESIYVSTPQRLDQNTSGLLVVATSKPFANYFAGLLAHKTQAQLAANGTADLAGAEAAAEPSTTESIAAPRESVHKLYRCLVCLTQPDPGEADGSAAWSVGDAYRTLQALQNRLVRHYLEPSIRSPKRFVLQPPDATAATAAWPECLLRIKRVGPLCALVGNAPAQRLQDALWPASTGDDCPDRCRAVVELNVELLTGRTHQIRGQLSALGYALVGDVQYGGAKPVRTLPYGVYVSTPKLALQCCELEFIEPNIKTNEDGEAVLTRSGKWNKFRLTTAWWTKALQDYKASLESVSNDAATTSTNDLDAITKTIRREKTSRKSARPDLLPSRVQLSPGKNKYILIKATHPNERQEEWFVKSASSSECGGPYHANVAQDLTEWITAAGYDVVVTGGGRIDYRPAEKKAVVYGFSYGYGKGDHIKAAKLICEQGIDAIYDYSDELY